MTREALIEQVGRWIGVRDPKLMAIEIENGFRRADPVGGWERWEPDGSSQLVIRYRGGVRKVESMEDKSASEPAKTASEVEAAGRAIGELAKVVAALLGPVMSEAKATTARDDTVTPVLEEARRRLKAALKNDQETIVSRLVLYFRGKKTTTWLLASPFVAAAIKHGASLESVAWLRDQAQAVWADPSSRTVAIGFAVTLGLKAWRAGRRFLARHVSLVGLDSTAPGSR